MLNFPDIIIKLEQASKFIDSPKCEQTEMLYDPRKESLNEREISIFIDKFNGETINFNTRPMKTPNKTLKIQISDSPFSTNLNENNMFMTPTPMKTGQKRKTRSFMKNIEKTESPIFGNIEKKENFEKSTTKFKCFCGLVFFIVL